MKKYHLPNFKDLDSPDRFDRLVDVFVDAKTAKILPARQDSLKTSPRIHIEQSRVLSMRNRLFALGYLDKNQENPIFDETLKTAILEFQEDAMLKATGSIDPLTWQAILELTNLESTISLERWYHAEMPLPVLEKAIYWRLFIFGFLADPFQPRNRRVEKAMADFQEVIWRLKIKTTAFDDLFSKQSVAILFDLDQLLETVSKAWINDQFQLKEVDRQNRSDRKFNNFLGCLAKVELELYGYDVQLNGKNDLKTPRNKKKSAPRYTLFRALMQFWQDTGSDKQSAWSNAQQIDGRLFIEFIQILKNPEALQQDSPSEHLYNMLIQEDESLLKKVWNHIQNIGHKIWDGIKRAWSWLFHKVAKVVKKTTHWIKNLGKLALHFAQQAFPIINSMMEAVKDTVSILSHRTFPNSNPASLSIRHDLDFDFTFFYNQSADKATYQPLLKDFQNKSTIFGLGIEIMANLIDILIDIGQKLVLGLGLSWFGFIISLVHSVKSLRELGLMTEAVTTK